MSKAATNTGPNSKNVRLDQIVAHRSAFLCFLSMRVEDSTTAEDILHSTYLKALEHGSEIRDSESTLAWFYLILRNAVIDQYLRTAARTEAPGEFANESPESSEHNLAQTICARFSDAVHDLKGANIERPFSKWTLVATPLMNSPGRNRSRRTMPRCACTRPGGQSHAN